MHNLKLTRAYGQAQVALLGMCLQRCIAGRRAGAASGTGWRQIDCFMPPLSRSHFFWCTHTTHAAGAAPSWPSRLPKRT